MGTITRTKLSTPAPIQSTKMTTVTTIHAAKAVATTLHRTMMRTIRPGWRSFGSTLPNGPVAGGRLVTITGSNLPENPEVLFGERRAELISVVAPNFIVVNTPAGNPGWVDVTIVDRATGAATVFAQGFAYVTDDQAPPVTTTATTPRSTSTTTILGAISSTSTSTTRVTTTMAVPSSTTLATSTTIPLPMPDQVSIDDWVDALLLTPEGRTLAPPAADAAMGRIPVSLWIGELCNEPLCPGWVLEE